MSVKVNGLISPTLPKHQRRGRITVRFASPKVVSKACTQLSPVFTGHYKSVVDLGEGARGQDWNLFVAMREPMQKGDVRATMILRHFIA